MREVLTNGRCVYGCRLRLGHGADAVVEIGRGRDDGESRLRVVVRGDAVGGAVAELGEQLVFVFDAPFT